ncbi:DNA primase-like protein [Motilibacter rhizosphaerae]|uniref:DNA primase-like protein n=1 Tax=Motilibacter rhizosphaerae TaxID=598652 RepID=A0A4Q7NWD2_9ACTN|nr:toprim domain-containing protein [Motilibacter rhizosphaerae]RZS91591.1 DNA primase-like protein [Motilibacter rhizosphaerae]
MAPARSAGRKAGGARDEARDKARDEARAAKLAELHGKLAEQVRSLSTGEDWKRWLQTAAVFPTYSFNNQLLIAMQRPDARAVAGYGAWQKLGRQVTYGERGIAVLAPIIRRAKANTADSDTPTGTSSPASAGSAEAGDGGEQRRGGRVVGFRQAYVWDVSQTTGEPLPEAPRPQLLQGQAPPGLWNALASLAEEQGFTVRRGETAPANGYTDFGSREVVVRPDVDDAQAVKTLAHELGHVLLHGPGGHGGEHGEPGRGHGRPEQEVEAESVAYLVAAAHGLDTDGYTFAYVAGWAAGRDAADPEQVVRGTAQRVLSAAGTVLAATQPDQAQVVGDELAEHVAASTAAADDLLARAEGVRDSLADAPAAPRPAARGTAVGQGQEPATPSATLSAMHAEAQAFYVERLARELAKHEAGGRSAAATALIERGLPASTTAAYGVGYAPATWTALTDHLRAKGYTDRQILDSGLGLRTSRDTVVDRFRNRMMFPVHAVAGANGTNGINGPQRELTNDLSDGTGVVIAFIGRSLDADAGEEGAAPKYLNSPETALYRKGEHLYGLGAPAVAAALDRGAVPVVVEGPWDAMAVSAADPDRFAGVAAAGTALTAAHVAQLAARVPLAERGVIVAMDEDTAGRQAAAATYPLLRATGAWPTYAPGLPGADPSKLSAEYGSDVLRASLSLAETHPLIERVIEQRLHGRDLSTAEDTVRAASYVAAALTDAPPARAAEVIARVSTFHGLRPEAVHTAYRAALEEHEEKRSRGGAR